MTRPRHRRIPCHVKGCLIPAAVTWREQPYCAPHYKELTR